MKIIERLREAHTNSVQRALGSDIFKVAADEIERLQELLNESCEESARCALKLGDAIRHLSVERQAYNDLARLRTEAETKLGERSAQLVEALRISEQRLGRLGTAQNLLRDYLEWLDSPSREYGWMTPDGWTARVKAFIVERQTPK